MRLWLTGLFAGVMMIAGACWGAAQTTISTPTGTILVPDSTIEHAKDKGKRAHTNHLIFLKSGGKRGPSGPTGETPGSLSCVYQTNGVSLSTGCPTSTSALPTGGIGVIAIVDAYDYPTAQHDFDTFSTQFGLPLSTANVCNGSNPCFTKVYATGTKPSTNCGWAQEEALDIEWAHSMAPHAQIILVEAASSSFSDLFQAVSVATQEIETCGGASCANGGIGEGEVSMSWGGGEFSTENQYDSYFSSSNNVVYFASTGDTGGKTSYPSTSPFVVAAGGTSVQRNRQGAFTGEVAWSGSGGGSSPYESRPSYQNVVVSTVGSQRGVPDFSFDADPSTGVSVYDSTPCQGLVNWEIFGGTSVASPSLSGIVNLASHFYGGSALELGVIYSNLGTGNFRDIISGKAGSLSAGTGWDFVTGVGSDVGVAGK